MSKSLRNFKTLRDIATNPFDARAFRFMIVSAQYRSALNFTPETFAAAVSSLRRIDKAVQALRERAAVRDNKDMNQKGEEEVREDLVGELVKLQNSFESALCDDVNTPRAIATVFSLISMAEKVLIASPSLSSASARLMLELFERMDAVLGLVYEVPKAYFGENKEALPIPDEIFDLARKRASFKASKMYAEADEVRRQISEAGFLVKDVKGGEFEVLRI